MNSRDGYTKRGSQNQLRLDRFIRYYYLAKRSRIKKVADVAAINDKQNAYYGRNPKARERLTNTVITR